MLRRWWTSGLSYAFPVGKHHQLILAAIGEDESESLAAAHAWLSEQDIDQSPFRDQRLLLAVAARFGHALRDHSAYPRLVGLQRMLWTRSRMMIQQAKGPLARIAAAGHELLLIKGASRLAGENAAGKNRAAWDIDLVVKAESMRPVFDILAADDWIPSPGTSLQYQRKHLPSTRSINLYKGNSGDIDLHSRPFHPGQGNEDDDARLWESALPATLAGVPVRVPGPEDQVAIAIAHGGLDGHTHSDWLVDCAAILRRHSLDWQRLEANLRSRNIEVPAAVVFHYFQDRLGMQVPAGFLRRLPGSSAKHPLRACASLIQVRPKDRSGTLGQIMRGVAKAYRKVSARRYMPHRADDYQLEVRRIGGAGGSEAGGFVEAYRLPPPADSREKASLDVEIVVEIQPIAVRRRVELEINSPDEHYCRIRFRTRNGCAAPLRLRVWGSIPSPPEGTTLELVSRPGRQLRQIATESERERYGSLAFRVVSCRVA